MSANTPLLPAALGGGDYLTQGAKPGALPGIALDLGLIRLKGTVALGTRVTTTFDGIPDVPLSKLTLSLSGGAKGALSTTKDLCRPRRPSRRNTARTRARPARRRSRRRSSGAPRWA